MERLNNQYNQLKSLIHRVKLAKSTEENNKGENLSLKLTSIEVKLENLRKMLQRFVSMIL
jgi:hypothetical protein